MSKKSRIIKSMGKNARKSIKKYNVVYEVSKGGRIFSVIFTKKDGSERKMVCRRKVTKHLRGGKSTINHKKNLVSVYDTQAKGYRCFNIDTLKQVKGCGNTYTF